MDLNELLSSVERVFIEFALLSPLDSLTMGIFGCFLNGHNSRGPGSAKLLGGLSSGNLSAGPYLLGPSALLLGPAPGDDGLLVVHVLEAIYGCFLFEYFNAGEVHRFRLTTLPLLLFDCFLDTVVLKLSHHSLLINLLDFLFNLLNFLSVIFEMLPVYMNILPNRSQFLFLEDLPVNVLVIFPGNNQLCFDGFEDVHVGDEILLLEKRTGFLLVPDNLVQIEVERFGEEVDVWAEGALVGELEL